MSHELVFIHVFVFLRFRLNKYRYRVGIFYFATVILPRWIILTKIITNSTQLNSTDNYGCRPMLWIFGVYFVCNGQI